MNDRRGNKQFHIHETLHISILFICFCYDKYVQVDRVRMLVKLVFSGADSSWQLPPFEFKFKDLMICVCFSMFLNACGELAAAQP